jgi:hypothetical protein
MKSMALMLASTLLVAGCAADVMIARRDSTLTGRGTVEAIGKRLSATIGGKQCNGNFANVRDSSSVGLINTYGTTNDSTNLSLTSPTGTATGVATSSGSSTTVRTVTAASTTGNAKGMLICDDGDVWRCEIRHDGASGFGVCVGKDGTVYDIITGFFGGKG